MSELVFGTDGWRGIIAADFTLANVERVARAYSAFVHSRDGANRGVVVGFDRRFLSEGMAARVATILADTGVPTWLGYAPATTPAVSQGVVAREAFGGLVVTASHNPPEFNGIKFKASFGGSASAEDVAEIGSFLDRPAPSRPASAVVVADLQEEHRQHLQQTIAPTGDHRPMRVVVDPMHGAASGLTPELLRARGHSVIEIRADRNPSFGGVSPEPIPPHVDALSRAVVDTGADIGVALDGDGDRIGAVDARGHFFSPHRLIAMLAHDALSSGQRGRIVKTVSTTAVLESICAEFDAPLTVTPVGFKYVCAEILKGDVLVGGEESGGLWTRGGNPERDGVRIALILIDMLAGGQEPLHVRWDALAERYGRFEYRRRDRHFDQSRQSHIESAAVELDQAGGRAVVDRDTRDGVKLVRGDGSWVMFRFSGTEPVLRLYAEARSVTECDGLLDEAEALVAEHGAASH